MMHLLATASEAAGGSGSWVALAFLAIFLAAFFALIYLLARSNRKRQDEDRRYTRMNIDTHREHAERAEEQMKRLESLLERIADALEKRS